ncbi:MAG: hypothetical protein WCF57_24105 [Pyrinomonadaceae bacterium]
MRNYRVYLRNGTQIKIKADSYRLADDRSAFQFYRGPNDPIHDLYVYAGEVAAIVPDREKGGKSEHHHGHDET